MIQYLKVQPVVKSLAVVGTVVGEPREVGRRFSARNKPRKLGPRPANLQATLEKRREPRNQETAKDEIRARL
jgi:hypothetical protein